MEEIRAQQLQMSFTRVFARKAVVVERFYHHLFTELPQVRPLFQGDFARQRNMFEVMLGRTIRELAQPGGIQEFGENLYKAHSSFDLTREYLEIGRQSLIAALKDALGQDISDEELASWDEAMSRLIDSMTRPSSVEAKAG